MSETGESVFNLLPKWPLLKVSLGTPGLLQWLLSWAQHPQNEVVCSNFTIPMASLDERLGEGKGRLACLCSSVLGKTSRCSHRQAQLPVHSKGDQVDSAWPFLTKLQNHTASLLLHSMGPSSQRPTQMQMGQAWLCLSVRGLSKNLKPLQVLCQSSMGTHKLSFSLDIVHIGKVLTNTRARWWGTGFLELIDSPRWCSNLLMRIFCFVKLVLNTFNSKATLVNPVFKFIATNPYSLWTSSERFRNINNVLTHLSGSYKTED